MTTQRGSDDASSDAVVSTRTRTLGGTEGTEHSPVGDEPPSAPAILPSSRYELHGEIARGGMGEVHRATDHVLGREVAVKVLQGRYSTAVAVSRRFVDEARISGQLQHPGIPAVHDLGTLPDGRPFLAMKLIKGRTLEELLRDRAETSEDRGRFIGAFEQICQAVAYAHSRRVIHRDLKPQNVMVGAFGEVQVMDWGLAKVLAGGEGHRPDPVDADDQKTATEILSLRDTDGSATQPGSILGTPAYIAPEQAVGSVEQVDERSDVFGLGAILAVILTGKPPYVSESAESTRVLASRGKLDDCLSRLDACGAEPELVALCKRCLSADREDRPGDAGEVASAVASLRAEAEERARRAELDRVRAEGETLERRQKRRTRFAAAAGVLALILAGGGGWLAVREQGGRRRADADRVASVALGRAEQLAKQAGAIDPSTASRAEDAIRLWDEAENAAAQAAKALEGVEGAETSARVAERAQAIQREAAWARRAGTLLTSLESAGSMDTGTTGQYGDGRSQAEAYRMAFAAVGIVVDDKPASVAALKAERPGLRSAILLALDDWTSALRSPPDPAEAAIRRVADLVDDDPFRREIRQASASKDKDALRRLIARPEADNPPDLTASMLGWALQNNGLIQESVGLFRRLRDRNPGHCNNQQGLADALAASAQGDPALLREAVGCAWAAVAIEPRSASARYSLGQVYLHDLKDLAEAEHQYRRTLELNPRYTFAMINLGWIAHLRGDREEAERWYGRAADTDRTFPKAVANLASSAEARGDLTAAESLWRKMLEIEPKKEIGYRDLAAFLWRKGDVEGAEAAFRKGIEVAEPDSGIYSLYGWFLREQDEPGRGEALLRGAVKARPKSPKPWDALAAFLSWRADSAGTEAALREAVALAPPGSVDALKDLAISLWARYDLAGAEETYRRVLEVAPKDRSTPINLAMISLQRGDREGCLAALRKCAEAWPKDSAPRFGLHFFGIGYFDLRQVEAGLRESLESVPPNLSSHLRLADVLDLRGDPAGAEDEYRKFAWGAVQLIQDSDRLTVRPWILARYLERRGDEAGCEATLRQHLALSPRDASRHDELAAFLERKGDRAAAEAEFRRAVEDAPRDGLALVQLGLFQERGGDRTGAGATIRRAAEVRPGSPGVWSAYAGLLERRGDRTGAEAALRKAIEAEPRSSARRLNLAAFLGRGRDFAAAEAACRQAMSLRTLDPAIHRSLADLLERKGDLAGAEAEWRLAVDACHQDMDYWVGLMRFRERQGNKAGADEAFAKVAEWLPRGWKEFTARAEVLLERGDLAGAEAAQRQAIDHAPGYGPAHRRLGRVLARKGDLAGAEESLRRAIEIDRRDPLAREELGSVLRRRGDLDGAIASYRAALERDPRTERPTRATLARLERMAALRPRLEGVLAGRDKPAGPDEAVAFAALLALPDQKRYADAARLYAGAFSGRPPSAEADPDELDRAARAASMASRGLGVGAPADRAAREALSARAREWFRAEVAALARLARSDLARDRKRAFDALLDRLVDPDPDEDLPGRPSGSTKIPSEDSADPTRAWIAAWAEARAAYEAARKPGIPSPPGPDFETLHKPRPFH